MKGQDLYEALSYVDPVMAEEAVRPARRSPWRRYLPVAACVALLLAGTAVAVFCGVEIRMLDVEDPETYAPYRVKLPTEADRLLVNSLWMNARLRAIWNYCYLPIM